MDQNIRDLGNILCRLSGVSYPTVLRWLNGEKVLLKNKIRLSEHYENAKRALEQANALTQKANDETKLG